MLGFIFSLIAVIFSILYVFIGNNAIENELIVQREIISRYIKDIDLDALQKIIKKQYGFVILPQMKIELMKKEEKKLNFIPGGKPLFDNRAIFLFDEKKVVALSKKKNGKTLWNKNFSQKITTVNFLDADRIIVGLNDGLIVCLKRSSGEILWQNLEIIFNTKSQKSPIQISFENDRRLLNSVLIIPQKMGFTLYDILDGKTLTEYKTDRNISHISDYDTTEKCLYIVEQNHLVKLFLNVM